MSTTTAARNTVVATPDTVSILVDATVPRAIDSLAALRRGAVTPIVSASVAP